MHIPDGYLSPSTCALLYGAAVPFWYAAVARVKRMLNTRFVPLLAVASAFCFVIMMFNIPLPGGTTGHAVGVGAAVVVLGPWASMLSLSIALLIQALFFGDGGITTRELLQYGNCGLFGGPRVYRVVAGRTVLTSRGRWRQPWPATRLSTLRLCLHELGIQPLFFRMPAPLPYAPVLAACRDSGDDDRASHLRRPGGILCFGRCGGLSPAY